MLNVCPGCGTDLVPAAVRPTGQPGENRLAGVKVRAYLVWAAFTAIWIFVGLAATLTIYEFYRISGMPTSFGTVAGMQFSEFLTFIPVSPVAFILALRYPIQRSNWIKPVLLHVFAGLAYNLGHIAFRGLTPYGYWDPAHHEWTFAFWDTHTHAFRNIWAVGKGLFLTTVVDDILASYIPIVIVAHAFVYYHGFHDREVQALRLEKELTSARLQTLKSQLQPHFLFNTLHSISALMLTDVTAADRMMTSLSDLLRMSLESDGIHLTTLSREIEFLEVYLDIEKIRFEERLRVVFDIAPECLDAQVPHLLLQPLVENAVRHGISKLPQGGEIRIAAKRAHGRTMEIWIRGNGPGVTIPVEQKPKAGLGLKVTRERLAAHFGEKQTCEFRNLPGGAEVYLQLPFRPIGVATLSDVIAPSSGSQLTGKSK